MLDDLVLVPQAQQVSTKAQSFASGSVRSLFCWGGPLDLAMALPMLICTSKQQQRPGHCAVPADYAATLQLTLSPSAMIKV
jgi:hypothetical protein